MKLAKALLVLAASLSLFTGVFLKDQEKDQELILAGIGWAILSLTASPVTTIILRDGMRLAPPQEADHER